MAGKILVLPEALTHQIAAGEVIERPASIVKELLENAIDAGATDIRIDLSGGGCDAVRVTDNGEGIAPVDVPRAFERYATSKIRDLEDIYRVRTFGFRGEALPSIASIARVEVVTKQKASLAGTRMIVTAGRVDEISETGSPDGTSIEVSRIFDPVPVRRKFLKSENAEQGLCLDVVTRTALCHPGVRLQVTSGGRDLLKVPATRDMAERIALVLGVDFAGHLLPLASAGDRFRIGGFASRPDYTRSNTRQMYCYVHRRYIRDPLLNHAIMTAYRNMIETKRYPAVVLFMDLPPGEVDVNVHPAKMEVRFRSPREIYHGVVETLSRSLAPAVSPGLLTVDPPAAMAAGPAGYLGRVEEALRRYTLSTGGGKRRFDRDSASRDDRVLSPLFDRRAASLQDIGPHEEKAVAFADLAYMGTFAETYLLFSGAGQLVIVDQHAAHERILFDRLERGERDGNAVGQRLLVPEIIGLTPRDASLLREAIPVFTKAGIDLEMFSGDSAAVKSVPAVLAHADIGRMIMDALEAYGETGQATSLQSRRERMLAVLACKAAVKANQALNRDEVTALCDALDRTPFSSTCPHGRPVYVRLGPGELEKMFKRR